MTDTQPPPVSQPNSAGTKNAPEPPVVPPTGWATAAEILGEEIDARGWTRAEFAARLALSQPMTRDILTGRVRIRSLLARQIGAALGTSAELWENLQAADRADSAARAVPDTGHPDAEVPVVVEPGWTRADVIDVPGGGSIRLLWWSDTRIGFEHRCDRGPRGVVVCAPLLTDVGRPAGHQLRDGWTSPTVSPSILCPDCGLHGFITEGRWIDA